MPNTSRPQTPANAEQITYWNDVGGPKWVRYQAMLDRQLEAIGNRAITASKIHAGANVLDVGCGCGSTTLEIARRVGISGRCVGLDISRPMLEVAQERARDGVVGNASFVEADAQVHQFDPDFHIVFSRFGVMFFDDPVAAFTNLRRALQPGGRLAFVCWQALHRNPWMSVPMMAAFQHVKIEPPASQDAPGPFAFADVARVEGILASAGFHAAALTGVDVELAIGGGADIDDTVAFLMDMGPLGRALAGESADIRAAVTRDVKSSIASYTTGGGVRMSGAVWIVTASV